MSEQQIEQQPEQQPVSQPEKSPQPQIQKPKFREVAQGHGGILPFTDRLLTPRNGDPPDPLLPIRHVGTLNCRSCVGVYFPITRYIAFVAHIDAYKSCTEPGVGKYAVADDTIGEQIKRHTVTQFELLFKSRSMAMPTLTKNDVLVVCPEATKKDRNGRIVKQVGYWVVEGIKEVLRLPGDFRADQEHHGFVVRHAPGEEKEVAMIGDGGEEDAFEAVHQPGLLNAEPGWVWDLDELVGSSRRESVGGGK